MRSTSAEWWSWAARLALALALLALVPVALEASALASLARVATVLWAMIAD
jgi:hypothetical protein